MDGIIFDVDGTLWDSTIPVAASWSEVVKKESTLNMDITIDMLKSVFGKTMDELTAVLFPMLSPEERTHLGNQCFQYENEYLEDHPGTLYEGITEMLSQLSQKYPLFIVSNCQQGYIEVFLRSLHLEKYFTDFLCFGDTKVSKDQTIRILMNKNNLNEVVYVGDTFGDYEACQKAGIPFIFAEYGFGSVPNHQPSIQKPLDLINLL